MLVEAEGKHPGQTHATSRYTPGVRATSEPRVPSELPNPRHRKAEGTRSAHRNAGSFDETHLRHPAKETGSGNVRGGKHCAPRHTSAVPNLEGERILGENESGLIGN